jgi:hypothetical protein
VRERPAQPVPRALNTATNTILVAAVRGHGARAVLALRTGLHLVDEVARSTAANVVDGSLLGAQTLLLLQFLVEAEHGALLFTVHVACTAAARSEVAGGRWWGQLDARCWATGGLAVGEVGGLDAGDVAGAAAAGVDVGAADGWVRLGDVEGRHCGGGGGCLCCVDVIGS